MHEKNWNIQNILLLKTDFAIKHYYLVRNMNGQTNIHGLNRSPHQQTFGEEQTNTEMILCERFTQIDFWP